MDSCLSMDRSPLPVLGEKRERTGPRDIERDEQAVRDVVRRKTSLVCVPFLCSVVK